MVVALDVLSLFECVYLVLLMSLLLVASIFDYFFASFIFNFFLFFGLYILLFVVFLLLFVVIV